MHYFYSKYFLRHYFLTTLTTSDFTLLIISCSGIAMAARQNLASIKKVVRIVSGYRMWHSIQWLLSSLMATYGVFSHIIMCNNNINSNFVLIAKSLFLKASYPLATISVSYFTETSIARLSNPLVAYMFEHFSCYWIDIERRCWLQLWMGDANVWHLSKR